MGKCKRKKRKVVTGYISQLWDGVWDEMGTFSIPYTLYRKRMGSDDVKVRVTVEEL